MCADRSTCKCLVSSQMHHMVTSNSYLKFFFYLFVEPEPLCSHHWKASHIAAKQHERIKYDTFLFSCPLQTEIQVEASELWNFIWIDFELQTSVRRVGYYSIRLQCLYYNSLLSWLKFISDEDFCNSASSRRKPTPCGFTPLRSYAKPINHSAALDAQQQPRARKSSALSGSAAQRYKVTTSPQQASGLAACGRAF